MRIMDGMVMCALLAGSGAAVWRGRPDARPNGAAPLAPEWVQRFGGYGWNRAAGVAIDGDGAVLVGGNAGGAIAVGPDGEPAKGDVLAKYRADGKLAWSRRLPPGAIGKVAAAPGGEAIVAGTFRDQLTIDGRMLVSDGSSDLFLARYGASGAPLWSRRFGTGDEEDLLALAVAPDGDLLVAARVGGASIALPPAPTVACGADQIVLARLTPAGQGRWARCVFSRSTFPRRASLAADAAGAVLALTGDTDVRFGDDWLSGGSYIARYAADGTLTAARALPTEWRIEALVSDRGKRLFVAGTTAAGGQDWRRVLLLAALDPDGEPRWSARIDEPGTAASAVAVDGQGGPIVLGGGGEGMYGRMFLAGFSPGGGRRFVRWLGQGPSPGEGALAAGDHGLAVATAGLRTPADLGGGPFAREGWNDAFLFRFTGEP
jgi:hypothetical protein